MTKEVRGNRLLSTIRKSLPNIGNVKLVGERRVTATFRGFPIVISSRLIVKEQGLGSKRFTNATETADCAHLQTRLRTS